MFTRLQASDAKHKRTALFWAITQRVVIFTYRRFGATYRCRNVGKELPEFYVFFWPCISV